MNLSRFFLAVLLLFALVLCGSSSSRAQESAAVPVEKSPEATALQKQIEALLTGWADEDLAAMERIWSAKSPQRAAFRATQERFFQNGDVLKVEGLRFRGTVAEGKALLRITTQRTWRSPITWATLTEPMVWEAYWEKEGGEWKLSEWEDCLVRKWIAFARGQTAEARSEAWKKDPETSTAWVVRQFGLVAEAFVQKGDWDGAIRSNNLQHEAAHLSGDRALVAEATGTRGSLYHAQAQPTRALEAWREAEATYLQAGDPMGAALMKMNQAVALETTGDFRRALDLTTQGLEAMRKAGKPERLTEALVNRGTLLFRLARYGEAEADLQEAIRISQELQWAWGAAKAVVNLASVREARGDYQAAREMNEASLSLARELRQGNEELRILNNLAIVLQGSGHYALSLQRTEEGLALAEKSGDAAARATLLTTRASALQDLGRYGEALASLFNALSLFRQQGARASEAIALQNLGVLYNLTGRDEDSRRSHEEAVTVAREVGDLRNKVAALVGLALYWVHKGDGTNIGEAMEAAHVAARKLGDPNAEVVVLLNWAHVLRRVKQYEGALRAAEEALRVARRMGDPRREAGAHQAIGLVSLGLGKEQEALQSFTEAIRLAKSVGDRKIEMECHWALGRLRAGQKQWRESIQSFEDGVRLLELVRTDTREQSLQTSLFAQYSATYAALAQAQLGAGSPAEAYRAAERAKARSLVDLLQRGKVTVTKALAEPELKEEQRLEVQLTSLSSELEKAQGLTTDQRLTLQQSLEKTRADYEEFRRRLFLRHQDLQVQRGEFTPAKLADLEAKLFAKNPGLCLLSYVSAEEETLLFALTPGAKPGAPAVVSCYRIPVKAADLRDQADQLRTACARAGGDYRGVAQKLFQQLVGPAGKQLAGKTHLVVVPDSGMPPLPFQALVDSQGKHLVERWSVSYAPSVTALVAMTELRDRRRKESAAPVPLLAVGRPEFASLGDLPATEKEARGIAGQAKGGRLLIGKEATEGRLRSELGKARYVHLATHGFLNEAAPLYSALALTPSEGSDGLLEARELMELDLKAEMVVLSACETGLGKQVRGEGVLGLTWALFVAGTPSSVVTHWQVEDASTGALMQAFYRGLLQPPVKGAAPLSKAQALRTAQLQLLKSKRQGHPYYWAPFVLVGDWR